MIVDTSAIVAIVKEEAGFDQLLEVIAAQAARRLSAASYVESAIVIDARRSAASADLDALLTRMGIAIEVVTESQARIARQAYQAYGKGSGHPARLNFGDCFAYALAKDKAEPLLFKGDDFARTDVQSAI